MKWQVGFIRQRIEDFSVGKPGEIRFLDLFENDGLRYAADPFGIERDGVLTILFEDFSIPDNKGRIAYVQVSEGRSALNSGVAIEEDVHMSYPFLIEHGGDIFCLPQRRGERELVLYRSIDFPGTWERAGVVFDDFMAVDASVVRFGGKWWMFAARGGETVNRELYIYYSGDLMGGWRPHAKNPVVVDPASARPAGTLFQVGGELFRPSQDNSGPYYGGALVVNRILTLSESEYSEEAVYRRMPEGLYNTGIHTMSSAGDFTLFDGSRFVTSWPVIKDKLRRKLS
jgi:hypothetical protein